MDGFVTVMGITALGFTTFLLLATDTGHDLLRLTGNLIGNTFDAIFRRRLKPTPIDPIESWRAERRKLRALEMKHWDDAFHLALPLPLEEHGPECQGWVEIEDEYIIAGDDIYALAISTGRCSACGWQGTIREDRRNYLQRTHFPKTIRKRNTMGSWITPTHYDMNVQEELNSMQKQGKIQ